MQADARTHCQEHIVQRDERVSFPLSLCSQPLPCLKPKVKKKGGGGQKRTLPHREEVPLFMRYYHSYRTKPWKWPSHRKRTEKIERECTTVLKT